LNSSESLTRRAFHGKVITPIILPEIIDDMREQETTQSEEKAKETVLHDKYKNSGLSKQKSLEYFAALIRLKQDKKPYLR